MFRIDHAIFIDDDHRLGCPAGDQVIEDEVLVSLFAPPCLVLTKTVQKVKHWIAFMRLVVARGGIHDDSSDLTCPIEPVPLRSQSSMRNIPNGEEFRLSSGNLEATDFFPGCKEDAAARIVRGEAVNRNCVVMKASCQWLCCYFPEAGGISGHLVCRLAEFHEQLNTVGEFRLDLERNAKILIHAWELSTRYVR